jgi:hypothetical protein
MASLVVLIECCFSAIVVLFFTAANSRRMEPALPTACARQNNR